MDKETEDQASGMIYPKSQASGDSNSGLLTPSWAPSDIYHCHSQFSRKVRTFQGIALNISSLF